MNIHTQPWASFKTRGLLVAQRKPTRTPCRLKAGPGSDMSLSMSGCFSGLWKIHHKFDLGQLQWSPALACCNLNIKCTARRGFLDVLRESLLYLKVRETVGGGGGSNPQTKHLPQVGLELAAHALAVDLQMQLPHARDDGFIPNASHASPMKEF